IRRDEKSRLGPHRNRKMTRSRNSQSGRSIIGLLAVFVVAILGILIISTSFPSLLVSRKGANQPAATAGQLMANEASVIMSLRMINSAEATYSAGDGQGAYGTLSALSSAGLIDQRWAGSPTISGYQFELVLDSAWSRGFCATARRLSDKSG